MTYNALCIGTLAELNMSAVIHLVLISLYSHSVLFEERRVSSELWPLGVIIKHLLFETKTYTRRAF